MFSVHYYTIATGNFDDKRSATNFGEDLYCGLYHGRRMEDLISQHTAVMDKYDPERLCLCWLMNGVSGQM